MSDTATAGLRLRDQPEGGNTDLWGEYVDEIWAILDRVATQFESYTVSASATISWTDFATNNVLQGANIKLTGPSGDDTLTSAATLTLPAYRASKNIWNKTGQDITLGISGGTPVVIKNGFIARIGSDGSDYTVLSPSQFATGLTLAGRVQGVSAAVSGTDAPNLAQVQSLIALATIAGAPGTVKTSVGATPGYLGAVLTGDDGTVSIVGSGSTLDFSVSGAITAPKAEILALAGQVASLVVSGVTVSAVANQRWQISGGQINLPAFSVNQWLIVEYVNDTDVVAHVGRSGQTIDGVAGNDSYTGVSGTGPIVGYFCTSVGAVVSKLIGAAQ